MKSDLVDKNSIASGRKLFLVDGVGALFSVFMHGVVLVSLEGLFGMPANVLFALAAVACLFAIYSITCSFLAGNNWKPLLKLIAVANLLFCVISIWLMAYFFKSLTAWGLLYFTGEVVVVTVLARYELCVSSA